MGAIYCLLCGGYGLLEKGDPQQHRVVKKRRVRSRRMGEEIQ